MARRPSTSRAWRSGLEERNGEKLTELGVDFSFETHVIKYTPPAKTRRYTPDFKLPNGIFIETKGWFTSADRVKHLHIQREHPSLDIRFVFTNPNARLSKTSKTTYAAWCDAHGFQYAKGFIPEDWINE